MSNRSDAQQTPAATSRRQWSDPRVQELPRLTELTLATEGAFIPGGAGTGGGGSTVIP
ncbi:hypothetical protein GQQ14_16780 [Pantoea agglomerans]|nr:hypothetical protein [Pantoea agglomerans]